ncbi:MAG TPA: DUF3108 domain-containing protein, partial [Pyrinomonadaceae bacterium]|nr:DUF3108 domain-containing protein [Pyrinomonadaceae bacterium]
MSLRDASGCHYHSKVHGKVSFSRKLAQFLFVLFIPYLAAAQQTDNTAALPFNAAAYRVGERLTYNVNYSSFVSAAHVELFVASRGTFFGREGIQLRAHVETSGVINVALLSINNDYTTFVYPESGLPYRAQQVVREAGRTTQAEVDYNQPAGTDAIPPKLRLGEFPGTYDLLSAIYRGRAMPLAPGFAYLINVRNENDEYAAAIKVTQKELIKTSVGSFDALVAKIDIKHSPLDNVHAYFSDDEWHVPVLITARYNNADIRMELAGSQLTVPAAVPRPSVEPATANPTRTPVTSPNIVPTSGAALDLPFKIGEQLNYRVFVGNTNTAIGSMSLSVKTRGRFFNRDGLQFTWLAQTSGGGILPIKDQMTSFVDPDTLVPFRTEINFAEGSWRNARNYNLDQERGLATVEGKTDRQEIPIGTHDLVSALYAIRTFDFSGLRQNAISIMAVDRPRTLFVKAERRETIELNGQKIPAIMLKVTTDDSDPDKLQIRMWIGDDARRLPLRITASMGTA